MLSEPKHKFVYLFDDLAVSEIFLYEKFNMSVLTKFI